MKLQTQTEAEQLASALKALSTQARKELGTELGKIEHLLVNGGKAQRAAYFKATTKTFRDVSIKYAKASQSLAFKILKGSGTQLSTIPQTCSLIKAQAIVGKGAKLGDGLISYLDGAMDMAVKRGYRETVMANAKFYARVPTGTYTCNWCVMLASRGFVYKTAESAGEGNQYHAHCDCLIVPAIRQDTNIDGYDPDHLYDLYQEGESIGKRDRSNKT